MSLLDQVARDLGSVLGRVRGKRGISLTEFALILPLLLMLVLGTIDLGMLTQTRLIVSNICREAGSISSRQLDVDPGIITLITASAKPLDLAGPDGKIYVTRLNAGQNAGAPNPTVETRLTGGGLASASRIGGGAPNMGLSAAIYDHLVYKGAPNNSADIAQVTVVEVFYKYHPITPISNFIPGFLTRDGNGVIIWSKAVF